MNSFYLDVVNLPENIQKALEKVPFRKKSILINVREKFCPRPPSMDGRRGFLAMVNLSENAATPFEFRWGSYGGQNMFTKTIDDVEGVAAIPADIACITGLSDAGAGYPASASIYISPANINPKLLPLKAEVSDREGMILGACKSFTSAYRKTWFEENKVEEFEIDNLVARGFLRRNKAGAISITTDGKNASSKVY